MSLEPGQRVTMIRQCATLLDKEDYSEIDLILEQHGMRTSEWHSSDTPRGYVMEMIKSAPDNNLVALHNFLQEEAGAGTPEDSPFNDEGVRVFFSHLSEHRDLVGEVSQAVGLYGVQAFVAHDSIQPSKQWQAVIEAGLSECDAMVVFLHNGFGESKYCDQEVGWVMGRRRPILLLSYDATMPHGFMSSIQARKVGTRSADEVAEDVITWLMRYPALHSRIAPGIIRAFAESGSFNFTRSAAEMLSSLQTITDDDLKLLLNAAVTNNQISEAGIGGLPGPEWVKKFVQARRTQEPADD